MPVVTLSGEVKKGSIKRGTYTTREGSEVESLQFRVAQDGQDRTALVEASGDRAKALEGLKAGDVFSMPVLVWLVEPDGKPAFNKFIVVGDK